MTLVLGSASPRRAELLAQLGVSFEVRAAHIDETPEPSEHPEVYVRRMAREKSEALLKAEAPRSDDDQAILVTADTTVILDDTSLGKPRDADDARQMLEALAGRCHEVATAVMVRRGDRAEETLVVTEVEFAALPPPLVDAYLETDEPWDKAGAYAIQGIAGSFVRRVSGSVSNVIGLPLVETRELLAAFNVRALVQRGRP